MTAVGNKISIFFLEIKSPVSTPEERSRWRNVQSMFIDRPPNVTLWSRWSVEVGESEIIDLVVLPLGRAPTEDRKTHIITGETLTAVVRDYNGARCPNKNVFFVQVEYL